MAIKLGKTIIIFLSKSILTLLYPQHWCDKTVLTLLLLQLSARFDVNSVKVNTEKGFILTGSYMEAGNGGCKCHINVSVELLMVQKNSLALRS